MTRAALALTLFYLIGKRNAGAISRAEYARALHSIQRRYDATKEN